MKNFIYTFVILIMISPAVFASSSTSWGNVSRDFGKFTGSAEKNSLSRAENHELDNDIQEINDALCDMELPNHCDSESSIFTSSISAGVEADLSQ